MQVFCAVSFWYCPAGHAKHAKAKLILKLLNLPTLVIHGENDRMCDVSGGRATAEAIPGAKLLTYPGLGHDLPKALWPEFAELIKALVDSTQLNRKQIRLSISRR